MSGPAGRSRAGSPAGRLVPAAPLALFTLALALAACAPRTRATGAENQVRALVSGFGRALKQVSLSAPPELAARDIRENYAPYVSPELLGRWAAAPARAPGRSTSSPWPDHIEISSPRRLPNGSYLVRGDIVLMTSVEVAGGGEAGRRPIALGVELRGSGWRITSASLSGHRP